MNIEQLRHILLQGQVIPAHPLALDASRQLDPLRQRGLTRYYLAAGAGALAVGVHTTQFEIHDSQHGLYRPVLELAMEEVNAQRGAFQQAVVMVAGLVGDTRQATTEANLARELGYDCGLLSLGGLSDWTESQLLAHCRAVAEILPLFGFYLQPAVGGRPLDFGFWSQFTEIENLVAIKVAPFNRYHTLDVVRAVAESGRGGEVALYSGNDDHILLDLLTPFEFTLGAAPRSMRFTGGLLGQWAVWTRQAVQLFQEVQGLVRTGTPIPPRLLTLAEQLTDANAAIFDAVNNFRGCIPGIHEVLRRQGLLQGSWCLDPEQQLSPGQADEIDRVCRAYPHLTDDAFVAEHLAEWLAES